MKGYFLCLLVSFALIGFGLGIAGAIMMGVSNENKCGDGCSAENCMTYPCTCGIKCEDYAVKSDNAGNKTYLIGAAFIGAGFGSFVLIIICTILFGYYCDCLKDRIMRMMDKRRKISISPS